MWGKGGENAGLGFSRPGYFCGGLVLVLNENDRGCKLGSFETKGEERVEIKGKRGPTGNEQQREGEVRGAKQESKWSESVRLRLIFYKFQAFQV